MNILDAIRFTRKAEIRTSGAAVVALAAPLSISKTVLSISEAIAGTKSLTERKVLDNLAHRVRIMATAVIRGDRNIDFQISDAERSSIADLVSGTKHGIVMVAQAVARGALLVLRSLVKNLVVPMFRVVGSVLVRCLPLIFNPATIALGVLGFGAYQFFKRFSEPKAGADLEIPEAPRSAYGAPERVPQPQQEVPRLVAPSSVIPGLTPEVPALTTGGVPVLKSTESRLPDKKLPLGIRNNNPGNLRFANQPGADPKSGAFAVFPSQNLGLYNMARQIGLHYYNRNRTTIRGLVQMWAPPNENNTSAYVSYVAKQTGLSPDAVFDFEDVETLKAVMKAIISQENGMMPYSDAQLTEAAKAAQAVFANRSLIMPTSGVISSSYGHRTAPKKGASTRHSGIDIAAPEGTPVVAAASGLVTFAGTRTGYGNTVDVKSGGIYTRYAHLKRLDVRAKDVVARGQKIGEVGNTGVSTGAHLHFEVRRVTADGSMGDPEDPVAYLGRGQKGQQVLAGSSITSQSKGPAESVNRNGRLVTLRS